MAKTELEDPLPEPFELDIGDVPTFAPVSLHLPPPRPPRPPSRWASPPPPRPAAESTLGPAQSREGGTVGGSGHPPPLGNETIAICVTGLARVLGAPFLPLRAFPTTPRLPSRSFALSPRHSDALLAACPPTSGSVLPFGQGPAAQAGRKSWPPYGGALWQRGAWLRAEERLCGEGPFRDVRAPHTALTL